MHSSALQLPLRPFIYSPALEFRRTIGSKWAAHSAQGKLALILARNLAIPQAQASKRQSVILLNDWDSGHHGRVVRSSGINRIDTVAVAQFL